MKRGSRVMGKKESGKFGSWLKKYKHAWVFLYIFIYMPWFLLLEKHVTTNYHVIQTQFDMWIPFVECGLRLSRLHLCIFSLRTYRDFIKWRSLCLPV